MDKIKKNTLVSMLIKLEGKKVGDTFRMELTYAETFGEYDDFLVLKEPLKVEDYS